MNCRGTIATLLSTIVLTSGVARGATIALLSYQGTGQDGMVYSNPSVPFPVSPAFKAIAVAKTSAVAHDTASLIQFDVGLSGLTAPDVLSATLKVNSIKSNVVNGTNQDPDPTHPIAIDVSPITASWSRSGVTWASQPTHGAVATSFSVDAINQAFTVDVTALVQAWLAAPATNFGLWLESPTIVGSGPNSDASPYWAAAFTGGFGIAPAFGGPGGINPGGPELIITTVPEPAGVALALCAVPALALLVRKASHRRRLKVNG